MSEDLELSAGRTRIKVAPLGAELRSLLTDDVQWLWHGDPAYWTGRSPARASSAIATTADSCRPST